MSSWKDIEKEFAGNFKNYAPEGEYKTKVSKVELVESSQKKTPGLNFFFADNEEYAFPKFGTTHWLSTSNENWRKYHNRELLRELGLTKEQAEKSVDLCEDKGDFDKVVSAYLAVFEKAVAKSGEVDVVVYKRKADDKYATVDFASGNVRMNRPEEESKEKKSDEPEDLESAEEISMDEIPF